MNNILLVLSPNRLSQNCINRAVSLAQADDLTLNILYIITPDEEDFVIKKVHELGFMGNGPAEELKETLQKNELLRAEDVLKEMDIELKVHHIQYNQQIITGDFYEEVKKFCRQLNPQKLLLTRARWNWLAKKWHGSVVDRFQKELNCPIEVVR